jgi:hypothetical protein
MSIAILVWHVFLGIGAILGFVSTGFLVVDRLFRYRPIVSISAVRGMSGGDHPTPVLHVKNVAPFDVLIERFVFEPPHLGVSANFETRAIVDVLTGADVPILLEAEAQRDLVIIVLDRANRRPDEHIRITVEWRRGISTWQRQWPVRVRTSIADIELREGAAMNGPRPRP